MQKQRLNLSTRKNTFYIVTYTTQEYLQEFGGFIADLPVNTSTLFSNITHLYWAEEYNAQNKCIGQSAVIVKYTDGSFGKEFGLFNFKPVTLKAMVDTLLNPEEC